MMNTEHAAESWSKNGREYWRCSRGCYEFCQQAAIEHLHPSFGRGQRDEIYSLGESTREADNVNFINRVMTWGPDGA